MYATADSGMRAEQLPRPTGPRLELVEAEPETTLTTKERVVELYEREYVAIARLAYLLVGDRHLAEDIAHDAFTKLYERWDDLRDEGKATAWLRASVSNLAMSSHRRRSVARRHAAVRSDESSAVADSAEFEALRRSARPEVVDALQRLSDKQRTAVVLKYWLRCTESEIAASMECSIGTARTHIQRGHTALATMLGGMR